MILCGVCKGEKRDPEWSGNVDCPRCPECGGSGLDAKGVQAFAEEMIGLLSRVLFVNGVDHTGYIRNLVEIVRGPKRAAFTIVTQGESRDE